MAVRDREQGQASDIRSDRRPLAAWRDILGALTPVLAVSAVLLYAYLSIAYDRFYRGLGVDPGDVGLSYSGTLARSSGFVVAYLAVAGFLVVVPAILTLGQPQARRTNRRRFNALLGLAGFMLVAMLIDPMLAAGYAARDVRAGMPVGPIRFQGVPMTPIPLPALPVLAIHADPATIEPAGKPGEAPAAERLRGRKVLYLGQANGTVALYDPGAQQAVYVSASSILLHVSNCNAAPSPDPACRQFQRY